MQENEFEKRVHHQMEEFRLRPSDAVWKKVEEELRKKKKRRVVVFIFLLAGLSLLGYTGYFISNQSKQNIAEQNFTQQSGGGSNENTKQPNNPPAHAIDSNESSSIHQDQLIIKPNPVDGFRRNDKSANPKDNDNSGIVNEKQVAEKGEPSISFKKSKLTGNKDVVQKNIHNKKTAYDYNKKENGLTDDETIISKNDFNKKVEPTKSEDVDMVQNNLEKEEPAVKEELAVDSVKKDSALAKVEEQEVKPVESKASAKTKAKIRWGVDMAIGLSGMRENGFLFSGGQKSMMDRMYNSPGSAGGNFNLPPTPPSAIKAGRAFKLGIVAHKDFTRKSSVSAGLQYAYMNTKMKIGSYWDTSVVVSNAVTQSLQLDAVYRGVQQKEYTNHYHFIQLPIQYHLRLNQGEKLPLLWNVGVSLGYLFNTNALLYDTTAGGIYYRDKQVFNKWQLQLNTGFSFRFGKPNKMQWSVGPEISLGLNKLLKDTYSSKQYLLYGGVNGRILFPRKK